MSTHSHAKTLLPNQLKANISLKHLNIETSNELDGHSDFLGQPRAKEALEFGISMTSPGYNLFVMGDPGTGRQSLASSYVKQKAKSTTSVSDICFVNHFEETREPYYLDIPAGMGQKLLKSMNEFIEELQDTFPAAFENPTYQRKRTAIDQTFNQKYDIAISEVDKKAGQYDVAVVSDGGSILLLPVVEGVALDDTTFAQLDEELRSEFQLRINELEAYLNEQLLELPTWKRDSSEQLRALNNETISVAIKPLIKQLERDYQNQIPVLKYVRELKNALPKIIIDLFSEDSEASTEHERRTELKSTLLPNVIVQNDPGEGVPVIYEMLPTYQNLFGRIEYNTQQGIPFTNYQLIRSGALHRANGGYLILDADKLLQEPFAWDSLKLALKTNLLKMESPFENVSSYHAVSLNPQSIPLNIKIILIGTRQLYYQLLDWDSEFTELFRVLVDFDSTIDKTETSVENFILRIKQYAESKEFKPITRKALELLIEFSLRESEHQFKFSGQIINVIKVLSEAEFIRNSQEDEFIRGRHIRAALAAAEHRTGRISEQLLQEIKEGTILIDIEGERIGCVNGLTVMELGESQFGSPARITATVYAGSQGVVDIEREAELGQAIHSKGVLILSGYLGQKYGRNYPLALSANLAMEQSYGYVDGDSATVAESCALISAIAQMPLQQKYAITGSMNQYGQVQAVGGINAKIEGYFNVCKSRYLNGQAVIIPKDNEKHLMLSDEVIQACEDGLFHIYSISHVEQALQLLLNETEDNIYEQVSSSLKSMSDLVLNKGKKG
ncbi:Lon protease family protein [Marinicellulosiphila megalodicopiae]|uniref:Lon protease family protein n=1 Tax=Marinicellulosiphila megalodicopiae TaxID=2724896 RepID=UPI003BAF94F0